VQFGSYAGLWTEGQRTVIDAEVVFNKSGRRRAIETLDLSIRVRDGSHAVAALI